MNTICGSFAIARLVRIIWIASEAWKTLAFLFNRGSLLNSCIFSSSIMPFTVPSDGTSQLVHVARYILMAKRGSPIQ